MTVNPQVGPDRHPEAEPRRAVQRVRAAGVLGHRDRPGADDRRRRRLQRVRLGEGRETRARQR